MVDLVVCNGRDVLCMDSDTGPDLLGSRPGWAVGVENGLIVWMGPSSEAPEARTTVDASGCVVLPGLVDCHTHAVWAGSRADEFRRRLAGENYTSILEQGGGILSTVRATRAANAQDLADSCAARLRHMQGLGVTTVEVKSGYGLDVETEARMLRAARAAGVDSNMGIVTTFLGAHAVPKEFRGDRSAYVESVIAEQLPVAAEFSDCIDVYVDRGAFTVEEGRRILSAGSALGLKVRVHAEQVAFTGAAAMAAELGATSADHLEQLDAAGVKAMADNGTVAVLLPGAMLYLRDPSPPVAALRDAGVRFAVATDLNPGSSPVRDLWTCATLACVTMGLTVEEALWGITRGGALALGRPELGVLRVGAPADVAVMEIPAGEDGADSLIQFLGGHRARAVIRGGQQVVGVCA